MKNILSIKFIEYLRENNPDVLFSLDEEGSLVSYISEKLNAVDDLISQLQMQHQPDYMIEANCMQILTEDLRPSKYNYIKELLEEEFIIEYQRLLQSGILRFEIINMILNCDSLFADFEFNEANEEDKNFRYTIIGAIREYFEKSERENRVSWPTMPIINL